MEKEKLYLDSGYFNFKYMRGRDTFNFCWGGRGTGKTYGSMQLLAQGEKPFIYLRRTQAQADLVMNPQMTPFKVPLSDLGIDHKTERAGKYIYAIKDTGESKRTIAYVMALSTFANIRGFDGSGIDELIFDEFVPERHAKKIRNEADAFFNCYETINRNRELSGGEPLKVYAFSNSDSAVCPIFTQLGLLSAVLDMSEKHEPYRRYTNEHISLYNLCDSPISKLKEETALYKATKGSEFNRMAINNEFLARNTGEIKSYNMKALSPLVTVGEICVYKINGTRKYYVSQYKSKTDVVLTSSDIDIQRFKAKYDYLWFAYLNYNLISENAVAEQIFLNYMDKT